MKISIIKVKKPKVVKPTAKGKERLNSKDF